MNSTEETFGSIWSFIGADEDNYTVLHETQTDIYKIYRSEDIEEITYTNYVVKNNFTQLNGTFFDYDQYFYVITKNNLIHCETMPAIFIPCGLNSFNPNKEVKYYLIYGKIMSQRQWLTWVKDTIKWPEAMASILGAKE